MSLAEAFPFLSPDARRAFGSEDYSRRVARIAAWTPGARILELGAGGSNAAIVLARDLGCTVVAADHDEAALGALRDRVRSLNLTERIDLKVVSYDSLPFAQGEFQGVILQGRYPYKASEALPGLRNLLAPSGRLVFTYPVKVGRHPARALLELWEQRLGEALLLPRELLQLLEKTGYEPQSVETVSDAELDELFRSAEASLGQQPADRAAELEAEIEAFRSQGTKSGVTFALAVGRRKEPGEKPPVSRDRG